MRWTVKDGITIKQAFYQIDVFYIVYLDSICRAYLSATITGIGCNWTNGGVFSRWTVGSDRIDSGSGGVTLVNWIDGIYGANFVAHPTFDAFVGIDNGLAIYQFDGIDRAMDNTFPATDTFIVVDFEI